MSLSSLLTGKPEIRGGLTADLQGRILKATPGPREETERAAASAAAAVDAFTSLGNTLGFSRLMLFQVKGPSRSTITAVRPHVFLLVTVDPDKATTEIEKTLLAWTPEAATTQPPPLPKSGPPPLKKNAVPAPPPAQVEGAGSQTAAAQVGRTDPWAALRRALVRGQLTEATVHQRELCAAGIRPGSEPLDVAACEQGMRVLLDGIGSVMAGDVLGGGNALGELTNASQSNITFRWVAYHWSTLAAVKSGNLASARAYVKEALTIARQIDMEAHAVSQWTAAEVLTQVGDQARALAWLNEARNRFERLGDRWGLGQTWFTEARIRASLQREQESVEAARMALAISPGWEEPAIFLARRALIRNDLAAADETLKPLQTPGADRVRALIEAIRQGTVNQTDASEFLKQQDAAPSSEAIRALERIANTSPKFVQAREALAWMLLKIGRYADAGTIFRGLLAQPLSPSDRSSVTLGLGCITHEQQAGAMPEKQLRAVMDASKNPPPLGTTADASPLPSLGSSNLTVNGAQAVFSGRLSGFALPDLLEFLRGARRTGLLACSSPLGMAALRFRDGLITCAAAPKTPDLGQILISAGKLSAAALRALVAKKGADQPDQVLGELLVSEKLVSVQAVQEALKRQIELAVRELVGWKDGEFAFNRDEKGELRSSSDIPVAIDPQAVLLEVFKEIDEVSRSRTVDVEI